MFIYLQNIVFTIPFILIAHFSFAQKDFEKHLINNEVTINYPDSTVFVQLYAGEKAIKPNVQLLYLWYRANDIKQTRGGIDGKALDGSYIVYYHDKNLKEKGYTKKGLRKGEWLRWYHKGELQEIVHWKNGLQDGAFFTYNEGGKLTSKGAFKKGNLHRKIYTFDEQGKFTVKKYKKGEFIKDIELKEKAPKKITEAKPKKLTEPNNTLAEIKVKKSWKEKLLAPFSWMKGKKKKEAATPAPKL